MTRVHTRIAVCYHRPFCWSLHSLCWGRPWQWSPSITRYKYKTLPLFISYRPTKLKNFIVEKGSVWRPRLWSDWWTVSLLDRWVIDGEKFINRQNTNQLEQVDWTKQIPLSRAETASEVRVQVIDKSTNKDRPDRCDLRISHERVIQLRVDTT